MGNVADRKTSRELERLLEKARKLLGDLHFGYVSKWKKRDPTRRVIGYFPIYVPREIIHAAGMLPVGIFGGGDRIQVVKGDAYFQSYICHLPRSVIEMALDGHFDDFDGFIFPAICDVIRNLSGIFRIEFPDRFIQYLDFPQNFSSDVGGKFLTESLREFQDQLHELSGAEESAEKLNHSISLYNENRRLVNQFIEGRSLEPWKISATDFYAVLRAGYVMDPEEHNDFLTGIMAHLREVDHQPEDRIRVIISGAFCEQPPMGLIRTIENAGCYIVGDDFQLGCFWIDGDIDDASEDPLQALAEAYVRQATFSSSVYDGNGSKGIHLAELARKRGADGVIFCAPSFCDPALLDQPELEKALDRGHMKHLSFQYHENLGQFKVIKEQVGTFSDSIKLWE
ncbi:MAG: benzoyl-CoA reductase subunit C [Candidatus Neomarinimicrobiota bacterium]